MILDFLGKKHGYVMTGLVQVGFAVLLAYFKPESLMGLAAVLTAINVPLYGGGALAKWGESRNGGNGLSQSS